MSGATAGKTGAPAPPKGWPGEVRAAGHRKPDNEAALLGGEAWSHFLDELRRAGEYVLDPRIPADPLERAEGYRHLAVMLKIGISEMLAAGDPDRPSFGWSDGTAKWGLDCSDAVYVGTSVRHPHVYRIRGRRGTVHFLGFQLVGKLRAIADVDADSLDLGPDGSFELIVGGEPRARNWMPLPEDGTTLHARQFFYDWDREEPARLAIERIDGGESRDPVPVAPGGIALQLEALGSFARASTEFWAGTALAKRDGFANTFPEDHGIGSVAQAAQKYQAFGIGYFALADDEALVVEVVPPRAKYWSLHLGNFWGESLDYANYQSSLNGHQARLDADGAFRAVVCRSDPGVPNWLDTAGHREGTMIYRWNQADGNPIPACRVVKKSALRRELPAGTPAVTPAERRAAVERRREHVRRRLSRPL